VWNVRVRNYLDRDIRLRGSVQQSLKLRLINPVVQHGLKEQHMQPDRLVTVKALLSAHPRGELGR
jgi:hypothetical protein